MKNSPTTEIIQQKQSPQRAICCQQCVIFYTRIAKWVNEKCNELQTKDFMSAPLVTKGHKVTAIDRADHRVFPLRILKGEDLGGVFIGANMVEPQSSWHQ